MITSYEPLLVVPMSYSDYSRADTRLTVYVPTFRQFINSWMTLPSTSPAITSIVATPAKDMAEYCSRSADIFMQGTDTHGTSLMLATTKVQPNKCAPETSVIFSRFPTPLNICYSTASFPCIKIICIPERFAGTPINFTVATGDEVAQLHVKGTIWRQIEQASKLKIATTTRWKQHASLTLRA